MCRSNPQMTSASIYSRKLSTILMKTNFTPDFLGSLNLVTVYVLVEIRKATVLMDTESTGSFISHNYDVGFKKKLLKN